MDMASAPRKKAGPRQPQDHLKPVTGSPEQSDEVTQAEIDLAAAQENQAFQHEQMGYLQNRVALLRVQVNRLQDEIAALRGEEK
jgi:hypothetical protein